MKVNTVRKNYFKGSKICWLKDYVNFGINLIYSKFGEIFHSVSRLPGYESVVKGEAHYTGQKVRHFNGTNLGGTKFDKFQTDQEISTGKIMHCHICQKYLF